MIRIVLLTPTLASAGSDMSYLVTPIYHWTVVEVNLAIVVACAMTLKPLLNRFMPRIVGSAAHPYKEHGSSRGASPNLGPRTIGGSGNSLASRVPPRHIRVDSSFTARVVEKSDEEMAILDSDANWLAGPWPPSPAHVAKPNQSSLVPLKE